MPAAPSASKKSQPSSEERGTVSWTIINFWLDAALLVVFLLLVWISFVLRFVFPRGTSAAGWTLWGYGYDDWANLQFGTLSVLMVGILVHVMFHWTWVCGVITSRFLSRKAKPPRWDDGTRTLVGVGLIVAIVNVLGALMALSVLMIRPPA
jgi:hypothetical protein